MIRLIETSNKKRNNNNQKEKSKTTKNFTVVTLDACWKAYNNLHLSKYYGKLKEVVKILQQYGNLGSRDGNGKVTKDDIVTALKKRGYGDNIWHFHLDGRKQWVVLYAVKNAEKEVFIINVGTHRDVLGCSSAVELSGNKLFEQDEDYNEGFVSINMRDVLEWQERQERKRFKKEYEYNF